LIIWSVRLQVAPGGVKLSPRRSQEVRGSLQLQNCGLRALEEVWMMTFRLRHFLSSLVVFGVLWARAGLAEEGLASSRATSGAVGKARAPERWPESTFGMLG